MRGFRKHNREGIYGKKGKYWSLMTIRVVTLSCKRILGAEGFNIITTDKGEAR
jgi:hypothetical protein